MNTRVTVTIPENFALPAELMLASGFTAGSEMECVFEQGQICLRVPSARVSAARQLFGMGRHLSAGRDVVAELVTERASDG